MEESTQRHIPAALLPGKRPGTHCTGGWVGPRAGLVEAEFRELKATIGGKCRTSFCGVSRQQLQNSLFVANYGELNNKKFISIFEIKLGERHFMTNEFVHFSVRVFHHLFVKVQSCTKEHFTTSTSDSSHTAAAAFHGHFLLSKVKVYFSILLSKLGSISNFFKEETSETGKNFCADCLYSLSDGNQSRIP